MYVEFSIKLISRLSAVLANILITLSSLAALSKPIGAVISTNATFPKRVVRAGIVFGEPISIAREITKIPFLVNSGWRHENFLPAVATRNGNAFVVRAIGIGLISRNPFAHALSATKVVPKSIGATAFPSKRSFAHCALDVNATVLVGISTRVMLAIPLARALTTAIKNFFPFDCTARPREFCAAFVARQMYACTRLRGYSASFTRHSKTNFDLPVLVEIFSSRGFPFATLRAVLQRGIHEVISCCSCIARSCGQVTGQTVQDMDQMPLAHKCNYTTSGATGVLSWI